jgi:hypothetical protein
MMPPHTRHLELSVARGNLDTAMIKPKGALYAALIAICFAALQAAAHGDPELEEHSVLKVHVVRGGAGLSSLEFDLVLPKMTVELLWRVNSNDRDAITFSVLSGETAVLKGLRNESKSRTPKLKRLAIGNVVGTNKPFVVEVIAHTVHWH